MIEVVSVLRSGQVSQGSKVVEFEEEFAEYTGAKFAIAVSSGTSALFLALKSLGIDRGDKVVVPSLTFTASAGVIKHCGADVVFADVDRKNFCINWGEVEELRVLAKPKAIIAVDLMGNDAMEFYDKYKNPSLDKIPKIIDSAHTIFKNCHVRGQIRTYSFHGTKNMTTGFGGMVTTDDPEVAAYIRLARMHGCYKRGWEKGKLDNNARRYGYDVLFPGWKMNMNNIQAAMGVAQLKRLDWMNGQRRRVVNRYNFHLGWFTQEALNQYKFRRGIHLYPIFVKDREKFLDHMEEMNVSCSLHFEPLHKMEAYLDSPPIRPLKVTEWIGEHIVSLPLFPDLKNKDIDYICKAIKQSDQLISL